MTGSKGAVSFTILSLVLAGAGIVAPVLWDWWSKRAELTVEKVQSAVVLQADKSIKDLRITYGEKEIEALTQVTLLVKNSGRASIVKDDVVSPLTIHFHRGEVLAANLVRMSPANLGAALTSSGNQVVVVFPLLNAGEEIQINVLVGGATAEYRVSARMRNISSVTTTAAGKQLQLRGQISWVVYLVGPLSALFFLAGIGLLLEIPRERRVLAAIKAGDAPFFMATTKRDLELFVRQQLGFLTSTRRRTVAAYIERQPDEIAGNEIAGFSTVVADATSQEPSLGAALVTFVFAGAGVWYVLTKVFV